MPKTKTSLLLLGLVCLALWPAMGYGQSPALGGASDRFSDLYSQGRYREALPFAEEALRLGEHELGPDHPTIATLLDNLAKLYYAQGRYTEAEPLDERAENGGDKSVHGSGGISQPRAEPPPVAFDLF